MTLAERFLTALAQTLSTMALYERRHPALRKVADHAFIRLQDLYDAGPDPVFTFLDHEVLLDGRPLPSLRAWTWARRLSDVGVQRIEIVGPPERRDFDVLLSELHDRLAADGEDTSSPATRTRGFRYGAVTIKASTGGAPGKGVDRPPVDLGPGDFLEEVGAFDWALEEVRRGAGLQMLEVELVVKALGAVMRGAVDFLIPVLRLKDYDQYTTVHSLNVSILAMALAEFLGLERDQIHSIGVAGILHDVGKIRVPKAVLEKNGRPTDDEWALIRRHPEDGARTILDSDERLELPAILAYEHHMRFDGGGYPTPASPRECHPLSHLLQVCDVYDALATHRPYRPAMPTAQIVELIGNGAGTEFEPHMAAAFIRMITQWRDRVTVVDDDDSDVFAVDEDLVTASAEGAASAADPVEG